MWRLGHAVLSATGRRIDWMLSPHPHVGFFPALPLEKTLALGEWMVGTPPADTPWRSPRFRELVETLLSSFRLLEFQAGSMLWHRERGFDGSAPSGDEMAAIRASVALTAFDTNDHLADWRKARCLVTAENAALYLQPIDEEQGRITLLKDGALRSDITGGWEIGQKALPLPDAVLPIDSPVSASTKVAKAVFDALTVPSYPRRDSISVALEWHRAAMANAAAVTLQQRLIALKTGFEALLDTSESWEGARRLRRLFEAKTAAHRHLLPWPGVLWSPRERTDLKRQFTTKHGETRQNTRSEIEDWFMTLAEARNSVIHEGVLSVHEYAPPPERPLSRYRGKLFWVGERLLREAVKATLGAEILLCGRIAERAKLEAIFDALQAQPARSAEQPPVPPSDKALAPRDAKEGATPAPRDLATLLQELGGPAANQVVLSEAAGSASASLEAAAQMAASVRGWWCATAGSRSILISAAERDFLEQAGAEEEIPDYFPACE